MIIVHLMLVRLLCRCVYRHPKSANGDEDDLGRYLFFVAEKSVQVHTQKSQSA